MNDRMPLSQDLEGEGISFSGLTGENTEKAYNAFEDLQWMMVVE